MKLTYQVLKVVERVTKKLIRDCINIDNIQFGFITGGGATGAIFIVRQLDEFEDKGGVHQSLS